MSVLRHVSSLGVIVTSIWIGQTASSGAAPAQPPARLEYAVFRNGDSVGRHVVDFDRQGPTTNVKISTKVAVTMAFITVYRFEHSDIETWYGNQLVSLKSQTNDDGTPHKVAVAAEGDHLKVAADGAQSMTPAAVLPASLWNAGTIHQSTLLNTLDGTLMRVRVQDQGEEMVKASGVKTPAHHYKISGGLDREVWFDRGNTLVRMQFAGKDGSEIIYELQ